MRVSGVTSPPVEEQARAGHHDDEQCDDTDDVVRAGEREGVVGGVRHPDGDEEGDVDDDGADRNEDLPAHLRVDIHADGYFGTRQKGFEAPLCTRRATDRAPELGAGFRLHRHPFAVCRFHPKRGFTCVERVEFDEYGMTHSVHTPASAARRRLPDDGLTGRAGRARREPMTVRALRDDTYLVDTEHSTYVVDLDGRSCTCPDHVVRGARCKHLRRVAIEVNEGLVPPPGKRDGACAVCGDRVFVPVGTDGSHLCPTHRPARGEFVADRETGKLLLVTRVTDERADERTTEDGRRISEFETNREYGGHEPVVEAVYVAGRRPSGGRLDVSGERRYGFPASRLRRLPADAAPSVPVVGV